ncbi:hypothetical protein Zmor_012814 [Zophobas morio]|uniref:Uncharacterized protein n=1 Tax=Zophobas morio TaxID=2755281 RepID=A0AA38MEP3_9CUCU|nr:hypothetical protein Zmor_012814 [Zophobas morio]
MAGRGDACAPHRAALAGVSQGSVRKPTLLPQLRNDIKIIDTSSAVRVIKTRRISAIREGRLLFRIAQSSSPALVISSIRGESYRITSRVRVGDYR